MLSSTTTNRAVSLRDLEAAATGDSRGVRVSCPRFKTSLEIGECLFCEHYQGLWLNDPTRCALRCGYGPAWARTPR